MCTLSLDDILDEGSKFQYSMFISFPQFIYCSHDEVYFPKLSCLIAADGGPLHSKWAPWASYQIRKIAGCACAGNARNVSPRRRLQSKTLVSDPVMHHGTCVTHVPWCMSGSLTRCGGENVPDIPGACAPAILRIWQEAHTTVVMHHIHDVTKPLVTLLLHCDVTWSAVA